jgi:phosphoadenosine phosphosulfate reductase
MNSSPIQKKGAAFSRDIEIPPLDHLNETFRMLGYRERIHLLYAYFKEQEVLVTSSFGTSSVFLLFLLYQLRPTQKIYFVDTGYHFPETLQYKKELEQRFQLSIQDVHPEIKDHEQTRKDLLWSTNQDGCCQVNKVLPLEPLKQQHKVWISGLMGFQNEYRADLPIFEQREDLIKFHPLIDLDEGEFLYEMERYQLPRHPLEDQGYGSIGCTHCTQKGEGRSGRWADLEKTECGLHPDFLNNFNKLK